MRLKDHYQTLGIPPSATPQEIKKAYRKLALQYHPDKNGDDAFATAHFKEVYEAYNTLSHANRRRAYDEERWLSGMGNRMPQQELISPQWILKECSKLRQHMTHIDTYRMSHQSLRDYILLILSDAHIAVLHKFSSAEINAGIIDEILIATQNLQAQYQDSIMEKLAQVAKGNNDLLQMIYKQQVKRKMQHKRDRLLPLWVILATLLLCLAMYFYTHIT